MTNPKVYALVMFLAVYTSATAYAEDCVITESNSNTVLSQYGFSWTISGTGKITGSFANGDCWIVGPVSVLNIKPASVNTSGWIQNGSELNPKGGNANSTNGYDNSMDYNSYSATLNVAPSITGKALSINTGSLVSTKSLSTSGNRPQLSSAAILTVLNTTPPARAFRPPYVGTDKTILGTADDLDYSILMNLEPVPSTPSLSVVTSYFEKPWMEQNTSWTGRYLHPKENQSDYGRDISRELGKGLLMLHLNFTEAQKESLYIRLVQYGIDVYGVAKSGGVWEDLGGHNQGRKMPLILAGAALGNNDILEYADAQAKFIFQEDRQTWYITPSDVGRKMYVADGKNRETYIQSDIGMPEWGEQHTRNPSRDSRSWGASYRDIVGSTILSHVLAAKLAGVEAIWNHPPLFDYAQRFFSIEETNRDKTSNDIDKFEAEMWERYSGNSREDIITSPLISPPGGTFLTATEVSLRSNISSSTIYYTIDGTEPSENSIKYTGSFVLDATSVVKAIAIDTNTNSISPIASESFLFGDSALVSDDQWSNAPFPDHADIFGLSFTMIPSDDFIDGVTGVSNGEIDSNTGYKGLAAIVRFNTNGTIDARNGDRYESLNTVNYKAGLEYHVTMTINMNTRTYNVSVKLQDGTEFIIAKDYSFRTEQENTPQLTNLAYVTLEPNNHLIKNFRLSSPPNPPLDPSSQVIK